MVTENSTPVGSASIINEKQEQIALSSKETLEKSGTYKKSVVTEIAPFTNFYPEEDYHNEYYESNRSQPYCMYVIDPKVQKLLEEYKNKLKGKVIG